jgi:hypothetical protein
MKKDNLNKSDIIITLFNLSQIQDQIPLIYSDLIPSYINGVGGYYMGKANCAGKKIRQAFKKNEDFRILCITIHKIMHDEFYDSIELISDRAVVAAYIAYQTNLHELSIPELMNALRKFGINILRYRLDKSIEDRFLDAIQGCGKIIKTALDIARETQCKEALAMVNNEVDVLKRLLSVPPNIKNSAGNEIPIGIWIDLISQIKLQISYNTLYLKSESTQTTPPTQTQSTQN